MSNLYYIQTRVANKEGDESSAAAMLETCIFLPAALEGDSATTNYALLPLLEDALAAENKILATDRKEGIPGHL